MSESRLIQISVPVALRKESVDRNHDDKGRAVYLEMSLSARRAWIEIAALGRPARYRLVALRKESVDRNPPAPFPSMLVICRSPQGERG